MPLFTSQETKLQAFNKLRRMPNDALCEIYNKIPGALPTSRKMMIKAILENAEINIVPVNPGEEEMSDEVMKKLQHFRLLVKMFSKIGAGVNLPLIKQAMGKIYDIHTDEVFVFKKGACHHIRDFMDWVGKNQADGKDMIEFYKEGLEKIREMVFLMRNEVFSACIGDVYDTAIIGLENRNQVNQSFRDADLDFTHLTVTLGNAVHKQVTEEEKQSIFASLNDEDVPVNSVVDMTQMDEIPDDDPSNSDDNVVADNPLEALLKNIDEDKDASVILCQGEAFKNPETRAKMREFIKKTDRYKLLNVSKLDKKIWGTFRRHNGIKGHVELYECIEPDNPENEAFKKKDGSLLLGPVVIM